MSRGQKLVLIYQMDESKDQIKEIAKKFQIQTRTISREMIGETMGHLIGRKGFGAAKEKVEDAQMTRPMLVMDGLQGKTLNSFLAALHQADLFVQLKAVITPINLTWPFCKLYHAIEEEDSEMRQAK